MNATTPRVSDTTLRPVRLVLRPPTALFVPVAKGFAVLNKANRCHGIGNILGLGDLPDTNQYMSVQEDPFLQMFNGNQLWDFDQQMIDILYPDYVDDIRQDLNRDGFVDEVVNYQMWTLLGGVDLRNHRGRTYSDDTSRKWDAVMVVEVEDGFSVLIEGHRTKEGKFKVASADDEGVIGRATRWLNGNQMTGGGYEDLFAMDFNGNNQTGF